MAAGILLTLIQYYVSLNDHKKNLSHFGFWKNKWSFQSCKAYNFKHCLKSLYTSFAGRIKYPGITY